MKFYAATGGILIAVIVGLVFRGTLVRELHALKLIPEEQHFTELYFIDSSTIATHYRKNDRLRFSFGIHNVQGVAMTYPYRIILSHNGVDTTIKTSTTTLWDSEVQSIQESFVVPFDVRTGRLTVELPEQRQHIDTLFRQ